MAGFRLDRVLLALVVFAAGVVGAATYRQFLDQPDRLFWEITHDRNAHYYQGLSMALHLRSFDVAGLARDVDSCRVWGVLHPVVLAIVEAIGGPDFRLGVLPSLVGWMGAAIFAFLLARQICPAGGSWAGAIAAALVLASPAHRAYATDVMIESSGACLTLAVLFAYAVWAQTPSRRSAVGLATAWSLLFFLKYNYWILVSGAMVVNEFARRPDAVRAALGWLASAGVGTLGRALRNPLTILAIVLLAIAGVIGATGGTTLALGKREISFRHPHNLVHAAYLLLLGQLLFWWVRFGRGQIAGWPESDRPLVYGHLVPVLFWMAMPKRLAYFFWYLSPTTADRTTAGFVNRMSHYWSTAQSEYHVDPLWLAAAVGLFVVAVALVGTLRPGAGAILVFVGVSAFLTSLHPMVKGRFLHSWIAVLWVAAAVGLVQGIRLICRSWPRAGEWSCGLAAAAVAALLVRLPSAPARAQEGGLHLDRPSTLVLSRTYLPELKSARNVALFCNVQTAFELRWTYLEQYRRTRGILTDIKGYDPASPEADAVLANFLASAKSDAVVLIDIPKTSPRYTATPLELDLAPIAQALAAQSRFALARQWRLDDGETIQLWTRQPSAER